MRRSEKDADRRLLTSIVLRGPLLHVGDAHHQLAGTAATAIRPWSDATVQTFREALRDFLSAIVAFGDADDADDGDGLVPTRKVGPIEYGVTALGARAGHRVLLTIDGDARDVIWLQVLTLIDRLGIARIRQCPGCPRIFVRIGKRNYCGSRCQNRVNQQRFRDAKSKLRQRQQSRKG